ncbi:MAG: putative molybdenum carrier protein [Nocardiopsaceae bacterium]|nr:putative molybdenum carrier protein [Nocardiopsaceae bacterium]
MDLDLQPDLELRAELRLTPAITVLTGGQTGVDTLAARAALSVGMPVHMVFPHGFRQEDGPLTAERRAELHGAVLHQLASSGFAQRTWTCVSLADAVLLIDPAGGNGCRETVRAADRLERPLLDLTGSSTGTGGSGSAGDVRSAVRSFISGNGAQVVMIAGCRGSLLAGQADGVHSLLEEVAAVLAECQDERVS